METTNELLHLGKLILVQRYEHSYMFYSNRYFV
jgi:hypothetical protein